MKVERNRERAESVLPPGPLSRIHRRGRKWRAWDPGYHRAELERVFAYGPTIADAVQSWNDGRRRHPTASDVAERVGLYDLGVSFWHRSRRSGGTQLDPQRMGAEVLERYASMFAIARGGDSDDELRERILAALRGQVTSTDEELANSNAARHEATRRELEASDPVFLPAVRNAPDVMRELSRGDGVPWIAAVPTVREWTADDE